MTRYYDPEVCRFISADVYMSTGQGVVGNNMFAYCLNNPILYFDTLGETPAVCIFGATVGLAPFIAVGAGLALAADIVINGEDALVMKAAKGITEPVETVMQVWQAVVIVATHPFNTGSGITVTTLPNVDSNLSEPYVYYRQHTRGARKSTKNKHERGQARRDRDKNGERGDLRRHYRKGDTKKVPRNIGPKHMLK